MNKEKEMLFKYALEYRKRCVYFKDVDRAKLNILAHKYTALIEVIDALGCLDEYCQVERG